uniref:Reverse transcriptase/retrotransposon-derived protein RNase H-like domain-containing protein n=1 Tax=Oreochromis niloticus TaxID=8128 RepID=A0A669DCK1_ORENI
MERDIQRLEQAVEENIPRLGSWRLKREDVSGHVSPPMGPDGASAPRRRPVTTDARAMLHGLPLSTHTPSPQPRAVMSTMPVKVPKYNGLTLLEPYLSQVRLAARHSGWSEEETATHLALALEGDALQILLDLAPAEQHELQALTAALERRFGQRHSTDQSREQLTNRSRRPTFLGHVISTQGIATDSAKVAAVRDWPTPSNVKELQSFLGLASYCRRFIKGFATIASPLHRLTDKGQPFGWGDACAAAFAQLKESLTRAPLLAYPDARQPFNVDTNASNVGVGAVLSQQGEAGERVVAYFSRALGRAERNYCVTRRELLAVVLAVRHFRPYLHGCRFLLCTDHASLTWLLNFKHPEGQVARWWEVLPGYDFEIQHRAGRQHGNADALSRRPCMAVECRYCLRQEEWAQEALGWLLLRPQPAEGGGSH